jgi:hypothetical protein
MLPYHTNKRAVTLHFYEHFHLPKSVEHMMLIFTVTTTHPIFKISGIS